MRLSSGHMATTVANRTTCRQCCSPQSNPQLHPAAMLCTSVSQPCQHWYGNGRTNSWTWQLSCSHLQVHPQQHSVAVVARLDERVAGVLRIPAMPNELLLREP